MKDEEGLEEGYLNSLILEKSSAVTITSLLADLSTELISSP